MIFRCACCVPLFFPAILPLIGGCSFVASTDVTINPFRDLEPIPLDGSVIPLESDIVPLGELLEGEVIRVWVSTETPIVDAVLILAEDDMLNDTGIVAGGGPANEPFDYRIPEPGRYFVFVQFDPAIPESQRVAEIRVSPGDETYVPPSTQTVLLEFTPGFLIDPGLFDPDSQTESDRAFLESISGTVQDGIIQRLQTVFQDTPVVVRVEEDSLPEGPFSRIIFSPERVLAENQIATDAALPPLDPSRPECQQRVIFGEVLPRSTNLDPGNRVHDDQAMVYVGSFQGRGAACQSAAINSVNNIVLGLAQTAAHEIGHLIGLYHVPLTDIMDRSPTQAFQRELTFARGQLLIDSQTENPDGSVTVSTTVLTTVIQDPDFYYRANFRAIGN